MSFNFKRTIVAMAIAASLSVFSKETALKMLPLHVKGNQVLAGNKPIRLRGINCGWWQLNKTVYAEKDIKKLADWGANVIRLPFFYRNITDKNVVLSPEKVKKMDEVIRWAGKYGIYVILDMHSCPGGQAKKHTKVFTDPVCQKQYFELWKALARRYKDNPVVAGYELMNEPDTIPRNEKLYHDTIAKVIAEIRTVDSKKIIVAGGDWGTIHQCSLSRFAKQDDPNILYTFHFYQGEFANSWIGNLGEQDEAFSGTIPWTKVEKVFSFGQDGKVPTLMCPMLRSVDNSGTVWFDDIEVINMKTGKTIYKTGFDNGPDIFIRERGAFPGAYYDKNTGHTKKGSLAVRNTDGYYGWILPKGKCFKVNPGDSFKIIGWVKVEKGTGKSYIGTTWFGFEYMTRDRIRIALENTRKFAKKYNVPLFVGEFAVERKVGPKGYQAERTANDIAVFEELGYHWTYWNYRETTNDQTMALQAQYKDGRDYPVNKPLLEALKTGWKLNKK